MVQQEIVEIHDALLESKYIAHVSFFKCSLRKELQDLMRKNRGRYQWILRQLSAGQSLCYYYQRKRRMSSASQENVPFKLLPIIRALRNTRVARERVHEFIELSCKFRDAQNEIQECQKLIDRVAFCQVCPHPRRINIRTSFVEEHSRVYTCSKCQLRLTSQGNFLSTDILEGRPIEYKYQYIVEELNRWMDRRRMKADDIYSRMAQLQPMVSETSVFLLQRFGAGCILYTREQRRLDRFYRSKQERNHQIYQEKIKYWLDWICAAARLKIWIKKCGTVHKKQQIIAQIEQQAQIAVVAEQKRMSEYEEDQLFISKFRRERQEYYMTIRKIKERKVPKIYRCFRPLCGGMRFPDEDAYMKHIEKHRMIDRRLKYEKKFIQRIGNLTPRRIESENKEAHERVFHNRLSSAAILLYVGDTPTSLPTIIPLSEGETIVGRSRSCTVRLLKNVVSKQHASLQLWYEHG